jgi:hypothetical protein
MISWFMVLFRNAKQEFSAKNQKNGRIEDKIE